MQLMLQLQAQQIEQAETEQNEGLIESTTILTQYKQASRLEDLEKSYVNLQKIAINFLFWSITKDIKIKYKERCYY